MGKTLQEYDLEFKPASIVKGQGLCKLMTENGKNEEHAWEDEAELHVMDVCPLFTTPKSWYRDLVHYLQSVRAAARTLEFQTKKSFVS